MGVQVHIHKTHRVSTDGKVVVQAEGNCGEVPGAPGEAIPGHEGCALR